MLINRLLPSIVICSAIHVKRDLKHSVGRFPRSDRNTKPVSSTFRDMYMHLSREDIVINRPKGGSPSPTSLAHLLDCIPPKFVFFLQLWTEFHSPSYSSTVHTNSHHVLVSCDIGLVLYVAQTKSIWVRWSWRLEAVTEKKEEVVILETLIEGKACSCAQLHPLLWTKSLTGVGNRLASWAWKADWGPICLKVSSITPGRLRR